MVPTKRRREFDAEKRVRTVVGGTRIVRGDLVCNRSKRVGFVMSYSDSRKLRPQVDTDTIRVRDVLQFFYDTWHRHRESANEY